MTYDEEMELWRSGLSLYEISLLRQIDDLTDERDKLANAIKTHRSQKADDRCIEDDDKLYEVLGDGIKCDRKVGCKKEMLKNCERFIDKRCEEGKWPTYAELEEKLKLCQKVLDQLHEYHLDESIHEECCPMDDTCSCKLVEEFNEAMEGYNG